MDNPTDGNGALGRDYQLAVVKAKARVIEHLGDWVLVEFIDGANEGQVVLLPADAAVELLEASDDDAAGERA